jgi:amidohydrolase
MTGIHPVDGISAELIAEAVSWRRQLHRHPELAYQEQHTANFVASQLAQFGLKIHRGLAGTGVVATLSRGSGSRCIAIRADMDALRMQERTGAAYASSNEGVMHACGHDGHVAMALAAARACSRLSDLNGTVHFIFQPAEEGGAGARRMVEEGLFRLFPCDAVYSLHNWPALPLGTCVVRDGPMMAANAIIEIQIIGRGCHSGMPHEGTDALLAGCKVVSALQTIVSRNIHPVESAVVSVTQIHAGTDALNVIPDRCILKGMARWFDKNIGDLLEQRITELAHAIAKGFACEAKILFDRRTPATINDAIAARYMRSVIDNSDLGLTLVDAQPTMGSEDFAYMLQAKQGCLLWLGSARSGGNPGLHSPLYDFNDEALPLGAAMWVALVRKTLARA